jgi:hypothetical protein
MTPINKLDVANNEFAPRIEGVNPRRFNADIRALKDSGSFVLPLSGAFGGLPQEIGRDSENDSRDSDNDSECRGNGFAVFLGKLAEAVPTNAENSREIGNAFLRSGYLMLACIDALLKGT